MNRKKTAQQIDTSSNSNTNTSTNPIEGATMNTTKTTTTTPKKSATATAKKAAASTTAASAVASQPPALTGSLASCLSFIEQAEAAHDATDPPALLTGAQKRVMLKLPAKATDQVTGVAKLWQRYGGTLETVDVSQMLTQLAHAQAVRELWSAASLLERSLDNDAFSAESSVWSQATQVYTLLGTLARSNPTLAAALEPFEKYFAEAAQTRKEAVASGIGTKAEQRKERQLRKAQAIVGQAGAQGGGTSGGATTPAAKPV